VATFNAKERAIECKIVYYGPGRCGKTTNLQYLFKTFKKNTVAEMVSINTKGDRTLYFDFLPMGLGKIRGCDVKVQLFTVPGQVKYTSTRKMVLKGVDGIVFVADSLEVRRQANLMSLKDLADNLNEENKSIARIPLVIQFNKRDLQGNGFPVMPIEIMEKELNSKLKAPYYLASATEGKGVSATLKEILLLTLRQLQRDLHWARENKVT
jgi:signal recognition particle receptor subunit beta